MGIAVPLWLKRLRRRQSSTFKPVVLVTGCASGIGLAIAERLYYDMRFRVVVTARAKSLKALRERFKEGLEVTPADFNPLNWFKNKS